MISLQDADRHRGVLCPSRPPPSPRERSKSDTSDLMSAKLALEPYHQHDRSDRGTGSPRRVRQRPFLPHSSQNQRQIGGNSGQLAG